MVTAIAFLIVVRCVVLSSGPLATPTHTEKLVYSSLVFEFVSIYVSTPSPRSSRLIRPISTGLIKR